MKLGLLADVHGNAGALQAVLEASKREGVEHILLAGDLVGYYFEPARVLDMLEPWPISIVRGNHEDMLSEARTDRAKQQEVESRYGSGLRLALEQLGQARLDALCSMPARSEHRIGGRHILLCHGAPWDTDTYLYPDASPELFARCAAEGFDLIVTGHTHYPMCKKVGSTLLLNPGSVGQPRDRRPGAQWASYDTASGDTAFFREPYDYIGLAREAERRHPELPYLSSVLLRT